MKSIIVFLIAGAIFATPCVTDIFSAEPSALGGGRRSHILRNGIEDLSSLAQL